MTSAPRETQNNPHDTPHCFYWGGRNHAYTKLTSAGCIFDTILMIRPLAAESQVEHNLPQVSAALICPSHSHPDQSDDNRDCHSDRDPRGNSISVFHLLSSLLRNGSLTCGNYRGFSALLKAKQNEQSSNRPNKCSRYPRQCFQQSQEHSGNQRQQRIWPLRAIVRYAPRRCISPVTVNGQAMQSRPSFPRSSSATRCATSRLLPVPNREAA